VEDGYRCDAAAYSRLHILVNDAGISGSAITSDLLDTAPGTA
jgi:hypothetical protein